VQVRLNYPNGRSQPGKDLKKREEPREKVSFRPVYRGGERRWSGSSKTPQWSFTFKEKALLGVVDEEAK